ncbi:MAG: sterol carrier family protein [Nocardioidaceae bacterium]
MSRQQRRADPAAVAAALAALRDGAAAPADLRLLSKHFLAVLSERAPGRSVEVRIPPYAAAQVVEGVRHTRGTPPAVVEMDADTWLALALGDLAWSDAEASSRLRASGERADLSPYLPLT